MTESNAAIQVLGLTKIYGAHTSTVVLAVDHISFDVRVGETFGFLGPNGAGKTTSIRILTGLARPTAGKASVMGLDLATDVTRIKKQIGAVPELSNLCTPSCPRSTTWFCDATVRRAARRDAVA